MGNNWTQEQYKAITQRNANILVAAAAGSGKTAVLVERIIGIVCDEVNPVDIDKLLVLTFTKAAAAQMRDRISSAIAKKIEENPESLHFQRQMILLNKANITTIDSFCLRLVKENYMYVDIDPGFRIADERELDLLKNQVLEQIFEDKYLSGKDIDFFTLIESFGEDLGDKELKKLVLEIFSFVLSNPFPKDWLNMSANNFKTDEHIRFEETMWGRFVLKDTLLTLEGLIKKLYSAIEITNKEKGPISYKDTLLSDLSFLDTLLLLAKKDIGKVKEELENFKFSSIGRKKKDDNEVMVNRVKNLREDVKKGIKELKEEYYFFDFKDMALLHGEIYSVTKALVSLVLEFYEEFSKLKKEKLLIDFSDMEHMALKILFEEESTIDNLVFSKTAYSIKERFYEVMTDEYQDSNLVQELILYAVSAGGKNKNNRFMVGDVKQSIYGFRQAEPSIFMEKFKKYKDEGAEVRIDLSKNFRSRENVLEAINLIFSQIMCHEIGDIVYDEKNALHYGAKFPSFDGESLQEAVELNIINQKELVDTFETDDDEDLNTAEAEMSVVAKRITEMIDGKFQIFDEKEGYRDIRFGDIVVLFRSLPNWANAAGKILGQAGIPILSPMQSEYFENTEVALVVNILKVIDNFRQDIPLIAVLKSPIYELSDDEILQIKLFGKHEEFYECIIEYIRNSDNMIIKNKIVRFHGEFVELKELSTYTPVSELLWTIYSQTGYYDYVGVKRLSKRRQGNLRLLVQKAEMLEATGFKGLFNFLNYIEKLEKFSSDDSEAVLTNENQDVVRIMTIHKSKGLEFPVVFVCGLGKKFNNADLRKKVLMHQKNGMGMEYVDFEKRVRYNTLSKSVIKNIKKKENLAEEMRVLYVALTRAKEKLILTASVNDLEKSCQKWSEYLDHEGDTLPIYDILKVNYYIDWIGVTLVRHRDGHKILDCADIMCLSENKSLNNSKWVINFIQRNEIYVKNEVLKQQEAIFSTAIDEDEKRDILKKLNFVYKYEELIKLPANISVTEIKRQRHKDAKNEEFVRLHPIEDDFIKSKILKNKINELSSSEKGTIMHTVMENLDLRHEYTKDEVMSKIEELQLKQVLTDKEAKSVDIRKIVSFFNSELGEMLRNAERIYKEEAFTMELTPYEVYQKECYKGVEEGILIHGIIDCFFIKDNQIVLIDYKSDYVHNKNEKSLIEKYNIQLEIYSKAIEQIIGKTVKERYIYSFFLDKAIKC